MPKPSLTLEDFDLDAAAAAEAEFTRRGVPDLPDVRFLLGYACARLRKQGASEALVLAYVVHSLQYCLGGRPPASTMDTPGR